MTLTQTSGRPCLRFTLGKGMPVSVLSKAGRRRSARSCARLWNRNYLCSFNNVIILEPKQVLEVPVRREPREIGIFHQRMSREKTPKQSDVGFENLKAKDLNTNSIMKRGTHTWTVLLLSKWTVSTTSLTALRNSETLPMTGTIQVYSQSP